MFFGKQRGSGMVTECLGRGYRPGKIRSITGSLRAFPPQRAALKYVRLWRITS
jgi:hypothetical protein